MAALSIQSISRSGLTPSLSSASSGGDTFEWGSNRFIEVDNGSGSSVDVTITSQYSSGPQGLTSDNIVVTVANGSRALIGPFSERAWADSNGNVNISYSATSSITVGAFEL